MIVNKVTKLYPDAGTNLSEEAIQAHIDAQNSDGYYLIYVDTSLRGWYRFFWAKEVQS